LYVETDEPNDFAVFELSIQLIPFLNSIHTPNFSGIPAYFSSNTELKDWLAKQWCHGGNCPETPPEIPRGH
jgi:hypothetical protein